MSLLLNITLLLDGHRSKGIDAKLSNNGSEDKGDRAGNLDRYVGLI